MDALVQKRQSLGGLNVSSTKLGCNALIGLRIGSVIHKRIVPTLCVGMQHGPLSGSERRSLSDWVPTQSATAIKLSTSTRRRSGPRPRYLHSDGSVIAPSSRARPAPTTLNLMAVTQRVGTISGTKLGYNALIRLRYV